MLTFQFVEKNTIATFDKGQKQEDETLDIETYLCYCKEKEIVYRPDIELIPSKYFNFFEELSKQKTKNTGAKLNLSHEMMVSLFDFQIKAIERMVNTKRILNGCSMGLGKSVQALGAMLSLRSDASNDIILCPGYLRENWLNEVERWCPSVKVYVYRGVSKENRKEDIKSLLMKKGLKIISYDMAANYFSELSSAARCRAYFNTVICDESHYLKDSKSKRYTMLSKTIKKSNNCFLLSGTPAPNRNQELFSQFSLIKPEVFSNSRLFSDRYCNGHLDQYNRYDDRGSSNEDELRYISRSLIIRLRREDYLDTIPKLWRQKLILCKAKSKSFDKKMTKFRELIKDQNDGKGEKVMQLQRLVSQMFLETAELKIRPVVDYLNDFVEKNKKKTILFCVHQCMLEAVCDNFEQKKIEFVKISGKTSMMSRPNVIREFLDNNGPQYAVLTIGSCSTGLNLVPVSQMIFLELIWSPSLLAQAECRINRIGGSSHLSYTYLLCQNTLDAFVFNKLEKKNQNSFSVVDQGKDYGDFNFHSKRIKRE